jgi:hypothetical protein
MAAVVALALWGATLAGEASAALVTVFSDDFSGAASAWGNQRGAWRVGGGTYDASLPSNSPVTYTDVTALTGLTNFEVEVDVNALEDGGVWLRSNFNGGNINGVLLVTGGIGGTNDGFYWHIVQNGSFSGILGAATQTGLQGNDAHLRITVVGDTYSLFLNGSASAFTTLNTNAFSSGSAGLYDFSPTSGASDPRGQTFDNFVVRVDRPNGDGSIPEPMTLALIGLGLAGIGVLRRRAR